MPSRNGGARQAAAVDVQHNGRAATGVSEILLALPPERQSCAVARRAVAAFCRTHRLGDFADDAALITSELVGNAVEHAGGLISLAAQIGAGRLLVRVTDDNSNLPADRDVDEDQLRERGRGLVVVDSLAGDWGATPHLLGKTVWFRLP